MTSNLIQSSPDQKWMALALSLAKKASQLKEIPVGAVIVKDDRLISTGFNMRESSQDPTSHAEIIAIQKACRILSNWRLNDCDLYVTLEPCLMCAGAIYQSRIKRVFYGTKDPKGGALGSLFEINNDHRLNHNFIVESGMLEESCREILKTFFGLFAINPRKLSSAKDLLYKPQNEIGSTQASIGEITSS